MATTAGLEIAPSATVEVAPANDGEAVDAPGAMSASRALFTFLRGGRAARAEFQDAFSFGALIASDHEFARVELDPFIDAIDPLWMGEVMETLSLDPGLVADPLDPAPAPTLEFQLDAPDGWVV